ncbi:MAG: DUF58 domain-containing protein [Ardenticatenaceae bacterium]|nr:DUF58 domain-containing protein [Ardenticatenaceae bacterium]
MSTRIELRLRLPLLWVAVLLVTAVFLPNRIWNTLLIGLGGLFVVAYWWVRTLKQGLTAQRRLRFGWVAVGDQLEELFEITNKSLLPALWVQVMDQANVPGYRTAVVRSVGGGQVDRWRQTAVCQQRGQFHLGPWQLRTSDPFGIFRLIQDYPIANEIIIHPPIHGRLPVQLPAGESSGRQQVRQRTWQATLNAATVRPYQPQDPHKWIHWPISAHRGELFVRQFDEDASGDVWLVLDLQKDVQLGSGADSTEEQAVLLAASLSARALRQNRAVGLAGYGQQPQIVPPARGHGQQWQILRTLALMKANGPTNIDLALRDLGRLAQRGTTAVLITPNLAPDWLPSLLPLAQQGIQSSVILLDRTSYGGTGSSTALQQAIRQLGFPCDILRRGQVGIPLQPQQRRGFWEFRVTASGRAVAVQQPSNQP